jgi:hypothetical protein
MPYSKESTVRAQRTGTTIKQRKNNGTNQPSVSLETIFFDMHVYNAGWRCGRIHACALFFAETQKLQHPQQRAFTDCAQSKTRKRAVACDTSKQSNHISLHHDTVRGPSMPCMTMHVLVARKGQKSTIGRHQSGALLHMQHAKRYNTL